MAELANESEHCGTKTNVQSNDPAVISLLVKNHCIFCLDKKSATLASIRSDPPSPQETDGYELIRRYFGVNTAELLNDIFDGVAYINKSLLSAEFPAPLLCSKCVDLIRRLNQMHYLLESTQHKILCTIRTIRNLIVERKSGSSQDKVLPRAKFETEILENCDHNFKCQQAAIKLLGDFQEALIEETQDVIEIHLEHLDQLLKYPTNTPVVNIGIENQNNAVKQDVSISIEESPIQGYDEASGHNIEFNFGNDTVEEDDVHTISSDAEDPEVEQDNIIAQKAVIPQTICDSDNNVIGATDTHNEYKENDFNSLLVTDETFTNTNRNLEHVQVTFERNFDSSFGVRIVKCRATGMESTNKSIECKKSQNYCNLDAEKSSRTVSQDSSNEEETSTSSDSSSSSSSCDSTSSDEEEDGDGEPRNNPKRTRKKKSKVVKKTPRVHRTIEKFKRNGQPKPFSCVPCEFYCSRVGNYRRHMWQTHQVEVGHKLNVRMYKCDVCGYFKSGARSIGFSQHLKKHETKAKNHTCEDCLGQFTTKQMYQFHACPQVGKVKGIHDDPNTDVRGKYKCRHCTYMCGGAKGLRKHTESEHPGYPTFICTLCPEGFSIKSPLITHMIIKHGATKYKCRICDDGQAEFTAMAALLRHGNLEHHGLGYMCSKCPKIVYDKTHFREHERQHNEEKNFICSTCGASFKTSNSLRRHVKCHDEDAKKHVCEFCPKRFIERSALNKHIKTHTCKNPKRGKKTI